LGKAFTYETVRKNLERAADCFGRALRIAGDNPGIEFHLGAVLYKQGKGDAALQYLQHVVELTDQLPDAIKFIGLVHHEKGELDEAIKYYELYIKKTPSPLDVYRLLGQAYAAKGQVQEAIDNYQLYVTKMPNAADASNITVELAKLRAKLSEKSPKS
jgi:tetratricopeptide (TPR) repeat protein